MRNCPGAARANIVTGHICREPCGVRRACPDHTEGFNILGYDKDGFNREGFSKEGYNR